MTKPTIRANANIFSRSVKPQMEYPCSFSHLSSNGASIPHFTLLPFNSPALHQSPLSNITLCSGVIDKISPSSRYTFTISLSPFTCSPLIIGYGLNPSFHPITKSFFISSIRLDVPFARVIGVSPVRQKSKGTTSS